MYSNCLFLKTAINVKLVVFPLLQPVNSTVTRETSRKLISKNFRNAYGSNGESTSSSGSVSSATSVSSNSSLVNGASATGSVTTPCTPGDPLTHYHHKNNDHYVGAFAMMNRMRIHGQVSQVSSQGITLK